MATQYIHILKMNDMNTGAFSSKKKAEDARDTELKMLADDGYHVSSKIRLGANQPLSIVATKGTDVIEYQITKLELNRARF